MLGCHLNSLPLGLAHRLPSPRDRSVCLTCSQSPAPTVCNNYLFFILACVLVAVSPHQQWTAGTSLHHRRRYYFPSTTTGKDNDDTDDQPEVTNVCSPHTHTVTNRRPLVSTVYCQPLPRDYPWSWPHTDDDATTADTASPTFPPGTSLIKKGTSAR